MYHAWVKSAYRVLLGKPEGKNLWEDRSRWKYNIKMDLETQVGGMHCIHLAQDGGQ
jgi:hypothetical protein